MGTGLEISTLTNKDYGPPCESCGERNDLRYVLIYTSLTDGRTLAEYVLCSNCLLRKME